MGRLERIIDVWGNESAYLNYYNEEGKPVYKDLRDGIVDTMCCDNLEDVIDGYGGEGIRYITDPDEIDIFLAMYELVN